jgi:N6-adenosine-specific RNA methylase IME4
MKIDAEFQALIPPLRPEEFAQLEANILAEGVRDPLVTWDGVLIDGHNRYAIATKHGLTYQVVTRDFANRDAACDWVDRNQLGRRNLHPDQFALLVGRRYNRAKKAQGGDRKSESIRQSDGLTTDGIFLEAGRKYNDSRTADRLAREHGVGARTVERAGDFAAAVDTVKAIAPTIEADVASGNAPARSAVIKAAQILDTNPEAAAAILRGEKTLPEVVREQRRAELVERLTAVEAVEAKAAAGVYDVLVIDPPWQMQKIERDVAPNQVEFDYPTMSEDELAALSLPLADDCHAWVWTTHKHLPMAMRLLDAWGLKYVCTFVWHKPGGFQPFGLPQYNCEFALYARRGTPQFVDTKAFPVCFDAPRGAHSEKPEAFYDVVRRVTAGRRLDMFNRRAIDGFDVWGNEAGA